MTFELRERDHGDGSESLPFLVLADRLTLADALSIGEHVSRTVDVLADGVYLVSFCGASPQWWLPGCHGGEMHQVGSHGWCHDCHKNGFGYVHHLAYPVELGVLANEARHDKYLYEMCEADGLTPDEYALEIAGRAVALDGDRSFVVDIQSICTDLEAGTADFAVEMWDMTTWRVTVPIGEAAPQAAARLAEERAHAATPGGCRDCKGRRGHSRRCLTRKLAELKDTYGV
jgi:hypothetical protein